MSTTKDLGGVPGFECQQPPIMFHCGLLAPREPIPLITTPPPADSPLAYKEDELISLINDVYRLFSDFAYVDPADITYPPPDTGRHVLPVERLRHEFNMSPRLISLVERLPYPKDPLSTQFQWFQEAVGLDFFDDSCLLYSRDPQLSVCDGKENLDPKYLGSDEVSLSFPWNGDGNAIILDIEANTLRFLYDIHEIYPEQVSDTYEIPYPNIPQHYRNFPGYHAPSVLRQYYKELRALRWVPIREQGILSSDNPQEIRGYILAKVAREHYGWPDTFRRDAWVADIKRLDEEAWNAEQDQTSTWEDRDRSADHIMAHLRELNI